MLVDLKKSVKTNLLHTTIVINERLPLSLQGPILLNCEYKIDKFSNFYLLELAVSGEIIINCQRCTGSFTHNFLNQSKIAICNSDEIAERLMNEYESIVSHNDQIDLSDIVTDELHLYVPEFHTKLVDCKEDIRSFLSTDSDL